MPIPSGGTPTMPRISAITGSEPAGTPAVPMPPRMHISSTTTCWPRLSSTPKNWARKSTVTPSKMAVPFWLAVAPMVRTKRETRDGSSSCSSATRIAVGRVALDEAVEKAITIASWLPRKNHERRDAAEQAQRDRIDDEHVEPEREQDDSDIGAEPDQQLPAEHRGEVEHEGGDGDRRQPDDDADQPHGDVEDALDRLLQPLRRRRVDQQQADAEHQSEEHHREDVVGGRGGDDVVGDDVEEGVDARRLLLGRRDDRPRPFARVGQHRAARAPDRRPRRG